MPCCSRQADARRPDPVSITYVPDSGDDPSARKCTKQKRCVWKKNQIWVASCVAASERKRTPPGEHAYTRRSRGYRNVLAVNKSLPTTITSVFGKRWGFFLTMFPSVFRQQHFLLVVRPSSVLISHKRHKYSAERYTLVWSVSTGPCLLLTGASPNLIVHEQYGRTIRTTRWLPAVNRRLPIRRYRTRDFYVCTVNEKIK